MNSMINQNMGRQEAIARFILGMTLIVAVYQPGVSPLLALVATYPVLTAMMKWDPVYALFVALCRPVKSRPSTGTPPNHQATA